MIRQNRTTVIGTFRGNGAVCSNRVFLASEFPASRKVDRAGAELLHRHSRLGEDFVELFQQSIDLEGLPEHFRRQPTLPCFYE